MFYCSLFINNIDFRLSYGMINSLEFLPLNEVTVLYME